MASTTHSLIRRIATRLASLFNSQLTVLIVVTYFVLAEVLICSFSGLLVLFQPSYQQGTLPNTPIELQQIAAKLQRTGSSLQQTQINPHANYFNRPVHPIAYQPDYLGPRPDVDTEANIALLVEACAGFPHSYDKVYDVGACLKYLEGEEKSYYYLPAQEKRAGSQSPSLSKFPGTAHLQANLSDYSISDSPSEVPFGHCSGPIVPYHTYWIGGASWRVEAFIKSYLFTQNLACSRLWIWLDVDDNQDALVKIFNDKIFARFIPLVKQGHIVLRAWKFPTQVKIPDPMTLPSSFIPEAVDVVKDDSGHFHVNIRIETMPFRPAAISDAMRFITLHLYGGTYLDMDMLLLRDLRPLLIAKDANWGERWGTSETPGDINTAALSLEAFSELSTYFLLGAIRQGVHFHPQSLGQMLIKDDREDQFPVFEDAFFDPMFSMIYTYTGDCPVPCLHLIDNAFKAEEQGDEWVSYQGELEKPHFIGDSKFDGNGSIDALNILASILTDKPIEEPGDLKVELEKAGIVKEYRPEEDRFQPKQRRLQDFYRGSYAYHVHNQWSKTPEPSSWLDVLQQAHNDFFAGRDPNPYGEMWKGPGLIAYDFYPEYL